MADMVNNDYNYFDEDPPHNQNDMEPKVIQHNFDKMSVKTARKDGNKYLGKDGTQAWRVSTLIGDDWYACMIYQEEFLPKKGQEFTIKLSENEGFKNWEYKLQTKKEQMQEMQEPTKPAQAFVGGAPMPPPPTQPVVNEKPPVNLHGRGAAWNNAFSLVILTVDPNGTLDVNKLCEEVEKIAKLIAPHQSKFVNGK